MAPYQYSSLNEPLNEIRVLTLQPGDFLADIHVSIHKVALTPEGPPLYEALSYVWGTTDNLVEIKIGPSGNERLAITQNLAEALPYLRYNDRTRTLWIDAICINQQDLRERSSQVKRMGDIYRLADRVVVWLGIEKDNSSHVLKMLSDLSSEIKVDYVNRTMLPASSDSPSHWSNTRRLLPYSGNALCNIDILLHRPWFSRLWVWQEVRLARNNAIIVCGSDTIPWQSLRQAIFCLAYKQWAYNIPSLDSGKLQARLFAIQRMSDSVSYTTFGDIIRRTASCKCSDPKDRVYAILSLLDISDEGINIEPDYTKTTAQVYQDVVLQHIDHRRKLEMLTYCELQNDRSIEMPSWVPNWAAADTAKPMGGGGKACGYTDANVQYRGGGVLKTTGVISATISSAEETIIQRNYGSVVDEIRRFAPRNVEHSPYVAGGSLIDAFCTALCNNCFSNTTRPPRSDYPQFEESREFLLAILQDKDRISNYITGADASKYLDHVWGLCDKRAFITTDEGYIGLAPKTTKPGDQICVLLGCAQPLVLRPTSDLQYQVVGQCNVHGIRHGEAFLGPLPDKYRAIQLYDQGSGSYYWAFIDENTGNAQYNDPRMDKSGQIDKEGVKWRLPDGSEGLGVTPEILKRWGVNVQDFDLI